MWVFILLLPSCSHPICKSREMKKTPHFPISDIYFADTTEGIPPGHDSLHAIHASQFPSTQHSWGWSLCSRIIIIKKSQLLLSAEVKHVAILSSLEAVNCSEQSSAPGALPTRGSGPGRVQTVSCVLDAPGSIKLRNISLCTETLWVIRAKTAHGLAHFFFEGGLWSVLFAREKRCLCSSDSLCTLGTTQWGSQKGSPEPVRVK